MKANKFMQIKEFLTNIFISTEKQDMDKFINHGAVYAVNNKIKEGYILDIDQEMNLKNELKVRYSYIGDVEKLFTYNLEDKYIYHIFFEKYKEALDIKENKYTQAINCLPLMKDWLLNQNQNKIAIEFFKSWTQQVEYELKNITNSEKIRQKFEQFNEFKDYLSYLPQEQKTALTDLLSNKMLKLVKKYKSKSINFYDFQPQLNELLGVLKNSEITNENRETNIGLIIKQFKDQQEERILESLNEVTQMYSVIFIEMNDMDKAKKENLLNLYHKKLNSTLEQYLQIKPTYRNKLMGKKTAQDLVLETVKDVKEVFKMVIEQINEEKLRNLSSKNEYLSQLKKQW